MTRDEISNMPAGKQIDALIAREVMKAHYWENGETSDYNGEYPMYSDWDDGVFYYTSADEGYLWTPSDHIADAWDVVEKMLEFEKDVAGHDQIIITRTDDCTKWYVEFRKPCWEYGEAETFSLAVCRAALLAVMES